MLCHGRNFQTNKSLEETRVLERKSKVTETALEMVDLAVVCEIEQKEVGFKKSTFLAFPCSLWHTEFYVSNSSCGLCQFGPVLCSRMSSVAVFFIQALEIWGCVLYVLCVTPC